MRGLRSTLILFGVLVGLGAYIYLVDSKKRPSSEADPAKRKVFSVEADTIEELAVTVASGERSALKKSGGTWQLVEPAAEAADQAEVSGIATNLASLDVQRDVEDNPADLKAYGLAPPRVDVGFKAAGDKDFTHLLIGDKTATGGDLYAKLSSGKRVFLVSGYVDGTFNRTPFDLRDKTILKFDRDKVDGVEIQTKDQRVQLAKVGDEWKLTYPVQARGDYGTVEGAIGRLHTAQMKSIVAAQATDLKPYGLDNPAIVATVAAGSARAALALGNASPDGPLYARDASRSTIFTVEASLADDLKKGSSDYRRKDVFEFRAFNASRIEIARGSETIAFEKVKGEGKDAQDKWRRVASAAAGEAATQKIDVDATKMDGLLTKLANLRAQSFAEAKTTTGLDRPVATVVVKFDDGKKQERLMFGRAGSDVYVSRADEPGAAKLDAKEFDEAMTALDSLKPQPAAKS